MNGKQKSRFREQEEKGTETEKQKAKWTMEYYGNALTWVLVLLNLSAAALLVRFLHERMSSLRWTALTLCGFVCAYIMTSAVFFFFRFFDLSLVLLGPLALFLVGDLVMLLRKKPLGKIDWDWKGRPFVLLLTVLALVVTWGKFGWYGMGQDEGVYQTEAILLMHGHTNRMEFEEYEKQEPEEEKALYLKGIETNFSHQGLEVIQFTLKENSVLPGLLNREVEAYGPTESIFHGIPTYPALLALSGMLFGMEHMAAIQTLFFVLAMLLLWVTGENLGLRTPAKLLLCGIYVLSPEAVWLSKSCLTESAQAMLMTLFLYFLTDEENPLHRWWSALAVAVFSLIHVTIFVMIPMFLALYVLLYLWRGDKQYLKALGLSAAGFMTGYTFMSVVSPRYTMANMERVIPKTMSMGMAYLLLMALGLFGLLLSLVLRRVRIRRGLEAFAQSGFCAWILRILIIALLGLSVAASVGKISGGEEAAAAITKNGFYNLAWMTGLVILPVSVLYMLLRPRKLLQREAGFAAVFVFLYAGLLMSCVLKAEISFCYYFGRYFVPYIPVVCVLSALIWNRFSNRSLGIGMTIGVLAMAPFDYILMNRQDDTRSGYEILSRISEAVSTPNSAVIWDNGYEDTAKLFGLPVRELSGTDLYFLEEDQAAQIERLAGRYDYVYSVTNKIRDHEVVLRIREPFSSDDDKTSRLPLCPFPYGFEERLNIYSVYLCASPSPEGNAGP